MKWICDNCGTWDNVISVDELCKLKCSNFSFCERCILNKYVQCEKCNNNIQMFTCDENNEYLRVCEICKCYKCKYCEDF